MTATYENVIISYSVAEPNTGYLKSWVQSVDSIFARHPGGVGTIVVIDRSAKPPSEAVREPIKHAIAQAGPKLRGVAQVVEGEGFGAAAKRSALAFITLIARFPFPVKIFASRKDAAQWMVDRLGDPALGPGAEAPMAGDLLEAIDLVCASHRANA